MKTKLWVVEDGTEVSFDSSENLKEEVSNPEKTDPTYFDETKFLFPFLWELVAKEKLL